MSDKRNADRRTVLAALGGTLLASSMVGTAQAQDDKQEIDGITLTGEDKPKSSDAKKPKELKKTGDIEILDYELLGGPTVFHGSVWVFTKDNSQTMTFGKVSKGPPPFHGMFEGDYFLDKNNLNWFTYDDDTFPRHALWVQLVLGAKHGLVRFRYGRKRIILPGWVWYPWERPLAAW